MPRSKSAADYPQQVVYSFSAGARILGKHPATLFRWAKSGQLKTVETPFGRGIHRNEIRRQAGEEEAEAEAADLKLKASAEELSTV